MSSSIENVRLEQGTTSTLFSQLKQFWNTLSNRWAINVSAANHEPQIREEQRYGERVWFVYDPATQRSLYLLSEADVRSWLEQRYHTQNTAHSPLRSPYRPVNYLRH